MIGKRAGAGKFESQITTCETLTDCIGLCRPHKRIYQHARDESHEFHVPLQGVNLPEKDHKHFLARPDSAKCCSRAFQNQILWIFMPIFY